MATRDKGKSSEPCEFYLIDALPARVSPALTRDKTSLKHWSRFDADSGSTLEQELFPISATVTGNIAVVQYNYMIARENYKKERETVTGHYRDVLIKDGGHWLFLAWAGGDDPKK